MCEYCHSFPHMPGCPCAPDPKVAAICAECKDEIFAGEDYWDFGFGPLCEYCKNEYVNGAKVKDDEWI